MARGGGAITAHCSGAHQRMRMAMSLCAQALNMAPRGGRGARRTTQDKKSAADAASAETASPLRAKRPSMLPTVLAVLVVVEAIDLPDSNHRSRGCTQAQPSERRSKA